MRRLAALVVLSAGCATPSSPGPSGPPHLEMYNVQDLVLCAGNMGRCEIPNHPKGCAQFEKKAKLAVMPAPWDEDGRSLVFQNGLLIVRADDSTQRSVRSFLSAERAKIPPGDK